MPYAKVGDIRLHYETAGESGSPVLLIMGLGARGVGWANQVPDLARHHRVVYFDNRGIGLSDKPPGLYSMSRLADDAAGLLDHLGWRQAHVVGVSMGGMIAQKLALDHRERVLSLSLVATHAGGLRSGLPPLRGLWRFLKASRGPREERLGELERLLFTPEFLASCDRAEIRAMVERDYADDPGPESGRNQLAAVLAYRGQGKLRRLAGVPTLVVRPGRDLLVRPRHSDRLHELIPGSRLLRLDDAGHGVVRQCVPELNAALLRHLKEADEALADGEHGRAA